MKATILCLLKNILKKIEKERKRTIYFDLEVVNYRSPQVWSLLPKHMALINSVDQFKISVRQWICNTCPCRLCKVYLKNIRFL